MPIGKVFCAISSHNTGTATTPVMMSAHAALCGNGPVSSPAVWIGRAVGRTTKDLDLSSSSVKDVQDHLLAL